MGKKKRKRFKIAISYAKEKQDLEKIKRPHISPNYPYPISISQQLGFHL